MKKRKFTDKEVNNTLDFLILLESNYHSGEGLTKLWQIARAQGVPMYTGVVKAMKQLKFITILGKNKKVLKADSFNLPHPTVSDARTLLNKMWKNQDEYNKVSNEKKSKLTSEPEYLGSKEIYDRLQDIVSGKENNKVNTKVETKVVEPVRIKIESAEMIMFIDAVIIINKFRIEGTFKLSTPDGISL